MKRDNYYTLIEEVVKGLNKEFTETVETAYDLGFKSGCNSLKRYAVNVIFFDEDFKIKDIFRMFETLEDARKYSERVSVHHASTYLYEYNHINEQYECMDMEF